MKKSKLDTPHVKKEVTKRIAAGESKSSIARDVGLHPSQVTRWSKREDVKQLIEEEVLNLLEAVPDAVENIKTLVREMKELPKDDHKSKELSFRACIKILESAGILPSQKGNVQTKVIINQEQPILTEKLQEIMSKYVNDLVPAGAIEVDFNK